MNLIGYVYLPVSEEYVYPTHPSAPTNYVDPVEYGAKIIEAINEYAATLSSSDKTAFLNAYSEYTSGGMSDVITQLQGGYLNAAANILGGMAQTGPSDPNAVPIMNQAFNSADGASPTIAQAFSALMLLNLNSN